MRPVFRYGTHVLQFTSDLAYPIEEIITSVQVSEETNAGVPRVQTLGDKDIEIINLKFDRLNLLDRAALLDWLQNIVKWKANYFEYTNQDGVTRNVWAWTDEFSFPIVNQNYATGTLSLRKVPS